MKTYNLPVGKNDPVYVLLFAHYLLKYSLHLTNWTLSIRRMMHPCSSQNRQASLYARTGSRLRWSHLFHDTQPISFESHFHISWNTATNRRTPISDTRPSCTAHSIWACLAACTDWKRSHSWTGTQCVGISSQYRIGLSTSSNQYWKFNIHLLVVDSNYCSSNKMAYSKPK